jgi:hypothetical protein
MNVTLPLPLRIEVTTSASQRFALSSFAEHASAVLVGSSVACTSTGTGVLLTATFEREIDSALQALRIHFPDLRIGRLEVTYLNEPQPLEPYVRVRVVTPEDSYGDIVGDLNRRVGRIEAMEDDPRGKAVFAVVPLSEMFGYDAALAKMTRGRGGVEYEFAGYQALHSGSDPPDPHRPARAMRA